MTELILQEESPARSTVIRRRLLHEWVEAFARLHPVIVIESESQDIGLERPSGSFLLFISSSKGLSKAKFDPLGTEWR
jgi:hypothetical protein